MRGNAKSSTTTSGCETKSKVRFWMGMRGKSKARDGERLKMKALLWINPRDPYRVRLECRGLEEVKSTVQARYTMTYIAYGDVCETQTYDVSY